MNANSLKAEIQLINQNAKFQCNVEGRTAIITDYIPPQGNNEGHTSLELLLLSLTTCVASTVKFMLNGRLKKEVKELKVQAMGVRKVKHPTGFKSIKLEMSIKGSDITTTDMDNIIQQAKSYSPVWAMLENIADIEINYQLN